MSKSGLKIRPTVRLARDRNEGSAARRRKQLFNHLVWRCAGEFFAILLNLRDICGDGFFLATAKESAAQYRHRQDF
jgi:hypothetical protein